MTELFLREEEEILRGGYATYLIRLSDMQTKEEEIEQSNRENKMIEGEMSREKEIMIALRFLGYEEKNKLS